MEDKKILFLEKLNKKLLNKEKNSSLYTKEKYESIIQSFKNIASSTHQKQYWALHKFELITIGDVEELMLKPVCNIICIYLQHNETFL